MEQIEQTEMHQKLKALLEEGKKTGKVTSKQLLNTLSLFRDNSPLWLTNPLIDFFLSVYTSDCREVSRLTKIAKGTVKMWTIN